MIEIANGRHKGINFYTQVMELDANAGNKQYYQDFDLPYDGDYILKFEYGARAGVPLKESSFIVVFNEIIILTIQLPKN